MEQSEELRLEDMIKKILANICYSIIFILHHIDIFHLPLDLLLGIKLVSCAQKQQKKERKLSVNNMLKCSTVKMLFSLVIMLTRTGQLRNILVVAMLASYHVVF